LSKLVTSILFYGGLAYLLFGWIVVKDDMAWFLGLLLVLGSWGIHYSGYINGHKSKDQKDV
jgi:hypothetical protein